MRTSSCSSSRSPTPIRTANKSNSYSSYLDPSFILYQICGLLSIICLLSVPVITLTIVKLKYPATAVYISFICFTSLHFFFMMRQFYLKKIINMYSLWYNVHFHYFINAVSIYLSGINPVPFFNAGFARTLYFVSLELDKHFASQRKTSFLAHLICSFTKPAIKSKNLHKFSVVLDLSVFPYMIFNTIFNFNIKAIFASVANFNLFILFSYMCDPYHKWAWTKIDQFFTKLAWTHQDTFGKHLLKIVHVCERFKCLGQFLYPDANDHQFNYESVLQ